VAVVLDYRPKTQSGLFAPLSLVLDQGPMFNVSRFAIKSSRIGEGAARPS
jgi:hypothetical protein